MEAIVGDSCNDGTFAETKPECWGEVVDDDEPAANIGVAVTPRETEEVVAKSSSTRTNRWRNS